MMRKVKAKNEGDLGPILDNLRRLLRQNKDHELVQAFQGKLGALQENRIYKKYANFKNLRADEVMDNPRLFLKRNATKYSEKWLELDRQCFWKNKVLIPELATPVGSEMHRLVSEVNVPYLDTYGDIRFEESQYSDRHEREKNIEKFYQFILDLGANIPACITMRCPRRESLAHKECEDSLRPSKPITATSSDIIKNPIYMPDMMGPSDHHDAEDDSFYEYISREEEMLCYIAHYSEYSGKSFLDINDEFLEHICGECSVKSMSYFETKLE